MPQARRRTFHATADRHQPSEPEGIHFRESCAPAKAGRARLRKTATGNTAVTAATGVTVATTLTNESRSRSSQLSTLEHEVCPVTGVYANISDDYHVSRNILGKGHYGVVRECTHRATCQTFAVKSIDKSKVGRLDHLQREIVLLASVHHPNVMKMVDCYEDAECVHIITEKYTGGELFDRIAEKCYSCGCLSERETAHVIKSLLEAVAYLHDKGIVHRDIKPENVLFESNNQYADVKLIDFGLSRQHGRGKRPMTNTVGTPYYMSPELLRGKYDKSTDVWSVGVVTYILLSGRPPFNGNNDEEIRSAARKGKARFEGVRWQSKSDDAVDFVRGLLRKDPLERLTAKEALGHPWIRSMMTC